LFRLTTQQLKKKMQVPDGRPVTDFLPTISIKAKDLAAEMTSLNVQNKNLKGHNPIEKEHVDNNIAVRDVLTKRGIVPEKITLVFLLYEASYIFSLNLHELLITSFPFNLSV
jgi:DNA-damage-inducible protein D